MPYGVPDQLWRRLAPDDQNEIINEYLGRGTVPDIGGYAPQAAPEPTSQPPREEQATEPPAVVWVFIRSANSLPGNHPDYDDLRAHGVNGVLVEASDPFAATVAETARTAGFHFGVWSDPHGQDGTSYGTDLVGKAHALGAELVAPDPESTGKGSPGSPEWQWHEDAAAAIRAADADIAIAVLPTPLQDDFNYKAWTDAGAVVWVQAYGEHLTDVLPVGQVRDRVIANGVDPSLVTVILPAGSLEGSVPEAQALGLSYWAIWTVDDLTPGDRSLPFGDSSGPSLIPAPGGASEDYGIVGIEDDENADHGSVALDPDVETWLDDYVAADEAGTLDETVALDTGGLRFLAAAKGTPGSAIHNTDSLPGYPAVDFPAKPGTNVLAPEDGIVRRFSGHPPNQLPPNGVGGAWGLSLYFRADSGHDYFITHMQQRNTRLGAFVFKGEKIGEVGDYPGLKYDHIHVGIFDNGAYFHERNVRIPPTVRTASGRVIQARVGSPHDLFDLRWFGRPTKAPLPVFTPEKPADLSTVGNAWDSLMGAMDTDKRAAAKQARAIADNLLGVVK